ncbi:MAG: LysM peptidoglycan-binding domain-containing protein [Bacilli bacterium]|nr:LysM peptidoglycan-binding domain-containing protein [Bacilli bacterium]
MSEAFVVERDFLFKDSIFEITSISVEHDEDINGSNLEGDFIISGDYRLHEISINKEDFSFKLPFIHEIRSNVNLDTVNLEITDFTYELNNNDELHVHIEYIVSGEQSLIEFADEKDLNEFLNKTDAEVVDLTEDEPRFKEVSKEEILNIPAEDSKKEEKEEPKEEIKEDKPSEISTNNIIGSINADETYVKYHVHTVMQNDTLEGILDKYKITLTELKKYNTFEALEVNMKLVIPENEEN